jgi:hypothetical protein
MKSLRESLLDDKLVEKTNKLIEDEIKAFLKENFIGADSCKISKNPNSDGKYEVSSTKDIEVKNKKITSLTNDTFIWGTVDGDFICEGCYFLNTLKGAPKEVGKTFYCSYCESLEALEGAPKEVGEYFNCHHCKVKFTEDDIRKVSNVKIQIVC